MWPHELGSQVLNLAETSKVLFIILQTSGDEGKGGENVQKDGIEVWLEIGLLALPKLKVFNLIFLAPLRLSIQPRPTQVCLELQG